LAHGDSFKWAASGGMDNTLKIWDLTSGMCRATCMHGGGVGSLKWHPTLPLIGTAALDNIIRLWDGRSGLCIREFTGHTSMVTRMDLMVVNQADGSQEETMVSVSDDNTAKVFRFNTNGL